MMATRRGLTVGILWLSLSLPATAGEARSPHVNYMLHCQGCHLPDGRGVPGTVPDMRRTVAPFLHLQGGREYLVQVPGVAFSHLDNASVAALMNWLVAEIGGGAPPDFAPYTEAEIRLLRSNRLRDVAGTRATILARDTSKGG